MSLMEKFCTSKILIIAIYVIMINRYKKIELKMSSVAVSSG